MVRSDRYLSKPDPVQAINRSVASPGRELGFRVEGLKPSSPFSHGGRELGFRGFLRPHHLSPSSSSLFSRVIGHLLPLSHRTISECSRSPCGRFAAPRFPSHTHQFVVARCCHAIPETPSNDLEQREVRQGKEYGRSHSYYIPKSLLCGSSISPTFLWGRNLSSQACVTSNSKRMTQRRAFLILMCLLKLIIRLTYLKKVSSKKVCSTPLFKIIIDASRPAVTGALNKWVEEGNALGRNEVSFTLLTLRKRKKYAKALQFMEWLESTKRLDFAERDYASQLDLIAKVYGINKAEKFIEKIPQSCRGEIIYRTLLANCVGAVNVSKAEEVFNKMRDLGLPISTFACNQLLLLYKRINKKKIADVLLLMERKM
uniref:Pentatricopeptide repeat-containing protein n=1 Tax=Ananas comosus var. bracteatus TaxID=296719 RepID=A0A6V7QA33_ANACO|nr:unnamed protein product [Ananas comosus var. bracteatus]